MLRSRATAPIAVAILALAVSLAGIGVPSIWYDESATVTAATRTWPQLWTMLHSVDAVHGLYYALIHLVIDVFGYTPTTIRVPSAVATALAAALTVVLGRQVLTARVGVLAGIVFCALPRATWMGTEARSYALTAALAVLLTIVVVHAARSTGRRWWVVYGMVVVLACGMFVYLALVVVAHTVSLLLLRRWTGRGASPVIRRFAVATAGSVVVLAPLVVEVVSQSRQVGWLEHVGWGTVRGVFVDQWFLDSPWFAILGWTMLAVGTVTLVRRQRMGEWLSSATIILPALLLPTVALVAYSVASPLYTPRYLSLCLPFVAVVVAVGLSVLPTRATLSLVLAALVILAIPPAVAERQPNSKQSTHWAEVADLIAAERRHDGVATTTAIVYGWVHNHPLATSRVIAHSYPDAFAGTVDVTLKTPAAQTGRLWETRNPLAESLARLDGAEITYLITSTSRDLRAQTTATLATVGWHVDRSWMLGDVWVLRYER